MSAMAILDGEASQLPAKEIDEHLESCVDCRHELQQQREVIGLLDRQSRRFFTDDVCSTIAAAAEEPRARAVRQRELCSLVVLGLILLAYKVIEVLPDITPGLVIKLIPLIPVFVFFGLLRQNPFVIVQNLKLEGEIS
jgi:predicted anti-sigma-YlaC factor YlaD